jgi:hypothetical protein
VAEQNIIDISDPVSYAQGLWPRGEWSFANVRLWRKELGRFDPKLVTQAIENVKCDKSSERVQLAWIIREIRQMEANRDREVGLRNRKESSSIDEGEVEWGRTQIMEELENQPTQLTDRLLEVVKAKFAGIASSGPVQDWSWMARGMVWAAGQQLGLWSGPPLEPSLDRELLSATERSACMDLINQLNSDPPSDQRPISQSPAPASVGQSEDLFVF